MNSRRGFVALISATLMSLILVGLAVTSATAGFFSRFNVLSVEFKHIADGLTESCANAALLKISQDYTYAPSGGGEVVQVGVESCVIESVTYVADAPNHRETATIKVHGTHRKSFSSLTIKAIIQDPMLAPTSLPFPSNISIISWENMP